MNAYSVYRDIQKRTKGQFLIGVVGPVRTGKSTLIRRFLEVLALPYLSEKEQAEVRDALPLSGEGKTITTVEPKFVPKDAVELQLGEGDPIRLRRIVRRAAAGEFSAGGGTNRCGAQKAGKALPDSCECEKTVPGGDTAAGKGA